MKLKIVGPHIKKNIDIAWIEVETAQGNFVIQKDHAPMILIVLPDHPVNVCMANGKIETFHKFGGILEIQRSQALLLLDE